MAWQSLTHSPLLFPLPSHKQWLRGGKEKWRSDLKHDIRLLSERLQILNEVVECAQQEVRRLYYGHNDPSNFGLLDIEVVPTGNAGAGAGRGPGGRYLQGKEASDASEEEAASLVRACTLLCVMQGLGSLAGWLAS